MMVLVKEKWFQMNKGFSLVEIMIVVAIIGILAATTLPSFVRARERTQENSIVSNLRVIQSAKDQWAIANGKATTDTPVNTDLEPYFEQNTFPASVAGETYSVGSVGTNPHADLASPLSGMTRIVGTN